VARITSNLLVLLIFLQTSQAQQREPHKSVQISIGYFSGEYLIYDCIKGNFACVDAESFEDCQESRGHFIKISEPKLPCVPLKKFPHFEDCEVAQYKEIESPRKKEFCFLKRSKIN
jgi:hypothetical protein